MSHHSQEDGSLTQAHGLAERPAVKQELTQGPSWVWPQEKHLLRATPSLARVQQRQTGQGKATWGRCPMSLLSIL